MKLSSLKSVKVLSIFGLIVATVLTINSFTTDRKDDMLARSGRLLSSSEHDKVLARVIPMNQRMPAEQIRYAAFGTSIAWGATLENKKDAFIWQLSPTASNFAIRATGAEFPAKCLSSMIGDEIYDVIVLEFTMRIDASAFALVQRLRQRFPDAIIINFMNWTPVMLRPESKVIHNARSFAEERGFLNNFMNDPNFHQFMREADMDWTVDWGVEAAEISHRMKHELGVINASSPLSKGDPMHYFDQSSRFSHDSFHLSESGHTDIADIIREIVNRVGALINPRVFDFHVKDECHNWYSSGVIDDEKVTFGQSGYMHKLPTNEQKYALSFANGKGWVTVTNSADHDQDLYISYLITSQVPSFYPITSVSLSTSNHEEEIVLDQTPKKNWEDRFVHMPREVYLGTIAPGNIRLFFRSLEKDKVMSPSSPDVHPFSLVSISVTSYKDPNAYQ